MLACLVLFELWHSKDNCELSSKLASGIIEKERIMSSMAVSFENNPLVQACIKKRFKINGLKGLLWKPESVYDL